VAILILSVFLALTGTGEAARPIWLVIVAMLLFFIVTIAFGYRILGALTRFVENLPISEGLLAFVIVITLLFAWAAEAVGGVAAITGAFIAGVFFGRTHFREEIERGMHTMTYSFFVPIFLVSIGLRANIRDINSQGLVFLLALILVAILSKVIGGGLGARVGGFPNLPSFRVGLGMVSRGEVGLIITTIGLSAGLVTNEEYSQVVIMVLVTTLVTPIFLRWAYSLTPREPAVTQPISPPQKPASE
jgi:Kef-type K+ transport system membrane component KefB